MLVLRRKEGKSLVFSHPAFPENVTVSILEIEPHRVKIGITAPNSVNVVRDELLPVKAKQGEQAIPECFQCADREEARTGLSPLALAYVERLEKIARLADKIYVKFLSRAISPQENQLADTLLVALSEVNFLSPIDGSFSTEEEEEQKPGELPREIIFK